MNCLIKIVITIVALILALLHQFVPAAKIDSITLLLICVAIIPWILSYLRSFEIPGVMKIELADTKAATDKITRIPQPGTTTLSIKTYPPTLKVEPSGDPFLTLRSVYESDPNLALVGFRIEIEKRIRELAHAYELSTVGIPPQSLVQQLTKNGVIPRDTGSGLMEMIALGNRAAHGVSVSPDAAAWLLDIGPSILLQLDSLTSSSANSGD